MDREIRYLVLKHKDIEAANLTDVEMQQLEDICCKIATTTRGTNHEKTAPA
jgi:hypothetical protein